MQQVVCVWLPAFGMQRFQNEHPDLRDRACVLYEDHGPRGGRVSECCPSAARHGVAPGMQLADAQGLLHAEVAHFEIHQPDHDTHELRELARGCQRFSPLIAIRQYPMIPIASRAPAGIDLCLLIDATGGTHLFGGARRLVVEIAIYLKSQGYFAHVALANSIGAAWAIARFGHATGTTRSMKSLPVEALRLPNSVVESLRQFDLRRIGQIMALPNESLPSRFGEILPRRLGQFSGTVSELIDPIHVSEPVTETWVTDFPINDRRRIAMVCEQLVCAICEYLHTRGEGLLRLEMQFLGSSREPVRNIGEEELSDAPEPVPLDLTLVSPVNNASYLSTLLVLRMERQRLPEWIHCVKASALWTAPLQIRQQSLFVDPQERVDNIADLLNHLTARLGKSAVVRPQLQSEIEPENAVCYLPVCEPANPGKTDTDQAPSAMRATDKQVPHPASARPLQLLPDPQPIRVSSLGLHGAPAMFIWKGRHFSIRHSTRPERLQTGWWRKSPVCRDYYRVETTTSQRFWVYLDNTTAQWYLHGIF